MKRDPWFPIAFMLLVLLAVWLGVAGALLDEAGAKGVLALIQGWQPLLAALVAGLAAWVAWKNVSRQLLLNMISREEERIEKTLPGLREAGEFLRPLLDALRSAHFPPSAAKVMGTMYPDGRSAAPYVRQKTPAADERLRRELTDIIDIVYMAACAVAAAHQRRQEAGNKQAMIYEYPPDEYQTIRDEVIVADTVLALQLANFRDALNAMDRAAENIAARSLRLTRRLAAIRQRIDEVIDAA